MSNTDVDFDELEDEQDDDSPVIRKLRTQLRNARKDSKDADTLRAKLHEYESRDAFTAADLGFNPSQQRAVLNELADPNDLSPEALRAASTRLGLYTPPNNDQDAGDAAAQAAIAAASAGAAVTATDGMLKPAEFAAWDMARRVDFMERHPEHFAAIERGETVRL